MIDRRLRLLSAACGVGVSVAAIGQPVASAPLSALFGQLYSEDGQSGFQTAPGPCVGFDIADVNDNVVAENGGGNFLPTPDGFGACGLDALSNENFAPQVSATLARLSSDIGAGVSNYQVTPTLNAIVLDTQAGLPVARRKDLGPALSDRAETIGDGRTIIGISLYHADYVRFNGQRLKNLGLGFLRSPSAGQVNASADPTLYSDTLTLVSRITLGTDRVSLLGTHGLTSRWDVGIVIPFVRNELRIRARTETSNTLNLDTVNCSTNPSFLDQPTGGDCADSFANGQATGLGDIVLRTKYKVVEDVTGEGPELAVIGAVSLPTGRERDFLGSGETRVMALGVLSQSIGQRAAGHINFGYETSSGDLDNVRYGAGLEVKLSEEWSVAADVIGRSYTHSKAPSNQLDLAGGVRWQPTAGVTIPVQVNLIFPADRNKGLQPEVGIYAGVNIEF